MSAAATHPRRGRRRSTSLAGASTCSSVIGRRPKSTWHASTSGPAQLLVDAEAGDTAAANGDFFSLDYIRDRIQHALTEADLARLNLELEELNGAVGDEDLTAAADLARQLRETLAGLVPRS